MTFSVFSKTSDGMGPAHGYSVRNMEWPVSMRSVVWYVPKGADSPIGRYQGYKLARWNAKYGYFAISGNPKDKVFNEGMNEGGLSASLLLFSASNAAARAWPPPPSKKKIKDEQFLDVANIIEYLLGGYVLVSCLIKDINNGVFPFVSISHATLKSIRPSLAEEEGEKQEVRECPLHVCVFDCKGDVAVLEWIEGEMRIYHGNHKHNDATGSKRGRIMGRACNVLSNSPSYDWHLENLRWHTWLKMTDDSYPKSVILANGYEVTSGARYMGLAGLPADLSSPTRFLRAAALSALTQRDFHDDRKFASHESRISHLFSLAGVLAEPKSYRHDYPKERDGELANGRTVWTVVHDHLGSSGSDGKNQKGNRAIYVQSYERKLILRFRFKEYRKISNAMACCDIDDKTRWGYWETVSPSKS
ncbi:MAG: linear amide C-N hydrolase [Xanthomonadaceae bacterium]|nr:linear amide C-N hydrolase [Xanthomonadaceae bacterium]